MFKIIDTADIAKKGPREKESKFEKSSIWKKLEPALSRIPEGKAIGIPLTNRLKEQTGHRRTVVRFLKKYLTDNRLRYTVRCVQEDGVDHVFVSHPEIARPPRPRKASASPTGMAKV